MTDNRKAAISIPRQWPHERRPWMLATRKQVEHWARSAALCDVVRSNYDEWAQLMTTTHNWSEQDCEDFLALFSKDIRLLRADLRAWVDADLNIH